MYHFLTKKAISLASSNNGAVLLGTPIETHVACFAFIEVSNIDSPAGGSASVSIGTAAPNYSDCMGPQDISIADLVGLNGGKPYEMKRRAIKNQALYLNINSTITGIFTVNVYLLGFQPNVEDVPIGSVRIWTTGTAPSGYLLCDGSDVSRTTYADLFAVIGTDFGVGDGSTTFNVPNIADLGVGLKYMIRT